MKLFQEMLVKLLEKETAQVTFPDLDTDPAKLIELKSYWALSRIKRIIEDDSLSDAECFQKIEQILQTFEALGSGGGNCHDFG
jgi:hypothetical protein